MRNVSRRLLAAAFAALLLPLACLPMGPLSGGRLGGDVHEGAVEDWSFANDVETVQLETNPADPHSVNVWCWGDGPRLYVPSSMILGPAKPDEREWVRNVAEDPRVRIRIDGTVYERRAVRVEDAAEVEVALAGLYAKYEEDPADREAEREIWVFRLEPR